MSWTELRRQVATLAWLLIWLILFLSMGIVLSVSRLRVVLEEERNVHLDHEANLLAVLLRQDLLDGRVSLFSRYLSAIENQHSELLDITVTSDTGTVLIRQQQGKSEDGNTITITKTIYAAGEKFILTLTEDPQPHRSHFSRVTTQNLLAAIFFTIIMGSVLFVLLRRTAIDSLEISLEAKRRQADSLEKRAAERTREWMQANSDLVRETEARRKTERLRELDRQQKAILSITAKHDADNRVVLNLVQQMNGILDVRTRGGSDFVTAFPLGG